MSQTEAQGCRASRTNTAADGTAFHCGTSSEKGSRERERERERGKDGTWTEKVPMPHAPLASLPTCPREARMLLCNHCIADVFLISCFLYTSEESRSILLFYGPVLSSTARKLREGGKRPLHAQIPSHSRTETSPHDCTTLSIHASNRNHGDDAGSRPVFLPLHATTRPLLTVTCRHQRR